MINTNNVRLQQFGLALPIMCAMVYLILGVGWDLWDRAWVIFLLIPLYYMVMSILPSDNAEARRHVFPTLIGAGYLVIGFLGYWHPGWIVMMLIPIYYIFSTPPPQRRPLEGRADTL